MFIVLSELEFRLGGSQSPITIAPWIWLITSFALVTHPTPPRVSQNKISKKSSRLHLIYTGVSEPKQICEYDLSRKESLPEAKGTTWGPAMESSIWLTAWNQNTPICPCPHLWKVYATALYRTFLKTAGIPWVFQTWKFYIWVVHADKHNMSTHFFMLDPWCVLYPSRISPKPWQLYYQDAPDTNLFVIYST